MQQHKQLVLVVLLAATCGSAHAFDGARSGFMVGVGDCGFHVSDLDVSRSDLVGTSGSEAGTQLRVTVGAGINEKFTLYGVYDIQADGDAAYGLIGPGATFYFRDTGPTFYLFGGTGLGLLTFDDDVPSGPNLLVMISNPLLAPVCYSAVATLSRKVFILMPA